MSYPTHFSVRPDKAALVDKYVGLSVDDLPTPSYLIDRKKFQKNATKMLHSAHHLQAAFRPHVKTHKTLDGTKLQLGVGNLTEFTTDRIVVSTLPEAWALEPLVQEGLLKDVLFSLPVVKSLLPELADLGSRVPHLRLMLDNAEQLDVLADFNKKFPGTKKWSIFVKINMGTNRAGLLNDTEFLNDTLKKALFDDDVKSSVDIYGFYCHAGHSYSSKDPSAAKKFLLEEIVHANKAAQLARDLDPSLSELQISVGATPTAHVFENLTAAELEASVGKLAGNLELHAGNYPCCDLQQISTGCVTSDDVSIRLLAEIVSTYPKRGDKGPGEQLINAGAIAMARESGPLPGHGRIAEPKGYENWIVGRLSQEHGILVPLEDDKTTKFIPYGTKVQIIPQHACITAANHPWYYVTDGGDKVVDIWIPAKFW